jgi:GABA(A) receptor-associated protein
MDSQIQERLNYSRKITNKYPNCVPVIIRKCENDKSLKQIPKEKYLIPKDMKISEVIYIIRKHLEIKPQQAIFIFVGKGILVPGGQSICEIYENYKANDEILYITYRSENTFG